MASSSFFESIYKDVETAVEQVSNMLDEVAEKVFGGETTTQSGSSGTSSSASDPQGGDQDFGDKDGDEDWDEDFVHPLESIGKNVLGNIMQGQVGPQTAKEHLEAFIAAVNWTEPFIVGILVLDLVLLVWTFWIARRRDPKTSGDFTTVRFVYLVVVGGLLYSLQYVNAYGARHWKELGISQNYFDSQGTFLSIFVGSPCLMMIFGVLVAHVREASSLLIQVKKMEMAAKKKKEKEATDSASNSSSSETKSKEDKKKK